MSTNHNRIRVADLETSQPNKILKTNQNGELEFSDANNLQAESYNALDCTTEGKTLDARQGKILKEMIDNKTVNLASDAETQINTAVTEDSKVVSRSKLFNWWQWIKTQTQTISGMWNFTNKVTFAQGTKDTPSLVIPNGVLTDTTQNGAIERDQIGFLYQTYNSSRKRILDDSDSDGFLKISYKGQKKTTSIPVFTNVSSSAITNSGTITTQVFGSTREGEYLLKTSDSYWICPNQYDPNKIPPAKVIFTFYLKGIDCTFNGQDKIKLYSTERTDINSGFSIRSYEMPISVFPEGSGYSCIKYEEKVFDNNGNIQSSIHQKFPLQSLNYNGNFGMGDKDFGTAKISFEIGVSIIFSDGTNITGKNAFGNPAITNLSTIVIKLN